MPGEKTGSTGVAGLTKKQRAFCNDVIAGLTPAEAARQNYSDTRIASYNMANPAIIARITHVLDRRGMHLERYLDKIDKLSEAKKSIVVDKEIASVEDNPTRIDAVKTVLKMHGALTEQEQNNTYNTQLNIQMTAADAEALTKVAEALSTLNKTLLTTGTLSENEGYDGTTTNTTGSTDGKEEIQAT